MVEGHGPQIGVGKLPAMQTNGGSFENDLESIAEPWNMTVLLGTLGAKKGPNSLDLNLS